MNILIRTLTVKNIYAIHPGYDLRKLRSVVQKRCRSKEVYISVVHYPMRAVLLKSVYTGGASRN